MTTDFIKNISKLISDKKGEAIVTLDVSSKCTYTDVLMIATGNSARQVQALADHVMENAGKKPLSTAGFKTGEWILIDFGDVIVHLFRPEARELYGLEKIWGEATADSSESGPLDETLRHPKRKATPSKGSRRL